MERQTQNFITIIRAALGFGTAPLDSPDWAALCTLAREQSVAALFNEGAGLYDEFNAAPPEIKQDMFRRSIATLSIQARRTEEFLGLYAALLDAGLKPLVLKGLVCRLTYGELADHRPSGDEDIYIKKTEFEKCRAVLNGLGYSMEELDVNKKVLDDVQEVTFSSPSGLEIEVHINPFGKDNLSRRRLNTYFSDAFETAVRIEADCGRYVYTMNPTLHYLFLFLHLYKHFTGSGVGIRQIIDLCMFDKTYRREIDFEIVMRTIKEMRAAALYADVLQIGKMLGFDAARELPPQRPEALLEDMLGAGVFGGRTEEQFYSVNVMRSAFDGKKSNVVRMLFPSLETMKFGHPVLIKAPWLLPWIWVKRAFKFVFVKKGAKFAEKGLEIGKRRLELMRGYGMID